MIIINFDSEKDTYKTASGLWQWDYGQKLQLVGLSLPAAVEIHFSLQQSGGEAVTRIGVTEDGVTTVDIPDEMLENGGKTTDYYIYAFVYLSDDESGETVYRISMSVKSRPRPKRVSETTMEALMAAINKIASGKADGLEYKDNILKLMSGEKELDRVTITGGSGGGEDAREIELQKGETALQWRYVGDPEWTDLISLVEITGPEGPAGADGLPGQDGAPGADGAPGKDGKDGHDGTPGADGITPHIGDNGNWYLGDTDTGKPSRGETGTTGPAGQDGTPGVDGKDGADGADGKSAYEYAQEGGYTGSEEDFAAKLAEEYPEWAKQPEKPSYTADEVGALPNTTKYLPNPKPLSFKDENGNLTETYNGQASKVVMIPTIPESLKNPYALTFTGAAVGNYDGSAALTINIPAGDGSDSSHYYVTPEQYGAVGDGVTDDTEAFRQAIETEHPIICHPGKNYYFAGEIITDKTRINIDGSHSQFDSFRLKANLDEEETTWKIAYPHPDSCIKNIDFVNGDNNAYCIRTGIPMKIQNIDVYGYDEWIKNYGDYMDYFVLDNLAIHSRPSNEHYCIELSYLGDNHVFRECRFGGYDTNINYVQVSGCKAVNFIDCIINGNVIAYQSVVNMNSCHFENEGQVINGDENVNSVINFNGCFFFDQYTLTPGAFYNGCGFLVNYRAYGGKNDYMALNTKDCIIFCSTESANANSYVRIDELKKNEYPNVVYSGDKVVFTPVVLTNTQKAWGIDAGTYTYKFFQSCNPYSIDYCDPAYSTGEESVTVAEDTSCVQFRSNLSTYPGMFIHAYRTSPDGSIKRAVIQITSNYIYDYGETLNGVMWKDVDSIPDPISTTAIYRDGVYYSGKNYTNAKNCVCIDITNKAIVYIDTEGNKFESDILVETITPEDLLAYIEAKPVSEEGSDA